MLLRSKQSGFSLLEAIVALVVFASVASALYAWLGVNLNALARVEAAREAREATQVGLAWLDIINPMAAPSGESNLGPYQLEWTSQILAQRTDAIGSAGEQSLYQVALFEVQLEIRGPMEEPVVLRVRRAGWEQVRDFTLPW